MPAERSAGIDMSTSSCIGGDSETSRSTETARVRGRKEGTMSVVPVLDHFSFVPWVGFLRANCESTLMAL